ncbi:hypothetical protein TKK_0003670 [Trichogramma kaykai]
MTELLLRNGADLLLVIKNGETLMHKLCQGDSDDTDAMERFFELADEVNQVVQIDARDKWGQTPLQVSKSSPRKNECSTNVELKLSTRAMIIVENLEKRGYEMNLGHVLEIMSLCFCYGWLDKPADFDEPWYDDEEVASKSKEITIRSNLSLHDSIQLRSKEAARRLEHKYYF